MRSVQCGAGNAVCRMCSLIHVCSISISIYVLLFHTALVMQCVECVLASPEPFKGDLTPN